MLKRSFILSSLLIAGLGAGCGGGYSTGPSGPPVAGGPTTALIPSGAYTGAQPSFAPPTLTVTAGTTVTFGNNDSTTHTTVADGGQWNSGNLEPGRTFTVKLDTPGTYSYHCVIHPFMTGKIVVQ